MFAIIQKELHYFTNTRKYRLLPFITFVIIAIILFCAIIEFYAQGINSEMRSNPIDVGKQAYTLALIGIFIIHIFVVNLAVDMVCVEKNNLHKKEKKWMYSENISLLSLTLMPNWKILCGKLAAAVIWTLWSICFLSPILVLSNYIGGLSINQYGIFIIVFIVNCTFYIIISYAIALSIPTKQAIGYSYGIIISIVFLPMIPISPFIDMPVIRTLSPIYTIYSIMKIDITYIWIEHVCVICLLCILFFPLLVRINR